MDKVTIKEIRLFGSFQFEKYKVRCTLNKNPFFNNFGRVWTKNFGPRSDSNCFLKKLWDEKPKMTF